MMLLKRYAPVGPKVGFSVHAVCMLVTGFFSLFTEMYRCAPFGWC